MESLKSRNLIRLSKSTIGDAEKKAVAGVLDREYLGMGAEVQRFEQNLTDFFGRPAVCVVNGTAALHLALQACNIGHVDEVLVQSLTYVASFQAISATGATPIACDVDPKTLTLNLHDAEKRITSRTKAVMPMHYGGGVGELDEIYKFAQKYRLRVIEDAAHAFGTMYNDKRVGSFGDIACFSFDGIKNITSGEGGCIVTKDQKIIEKIQDTRLLGVERDTSRRFAGERSWDFEVSNQGWRYHMSNIMAAIGIEQLARFEVVSKKRQLLANTYSYLLRDFEELSLIEHDYNDVVPHIFVVKLSNSLSREVIRKELLAHGIETGIHYKPAHLLKIYKNQESVDLVETNSIYRNLLTLPLHIDMSIEDVEYVVDKLKNIISNYFEH